MLIILVVVVIVRKKQKAKMRTTQASDANESPGNAPYENQSNYLRYQENAYTINAYPQNAYLYIGGYAQGQQPMYEKNKQYQSNVIKANNVTNQRTYSSDTMACKEK